MSIQESVNIYDFDKTIYKGHSSIEFFLYCASKHPKVFKYFYRNIFDSCRVKMNILNLEESETNYCDFLQEIRDVNEMISTYWKQNLHRIQPWYLEQQEKSDVVITSSPEFLVKYACDKIGIENLIATRFDEDGNLLGKVCFKEEKARRFKQEFPDVEVDSCYTDCVVDDDPILSLAKNKYKVTGNKIKKLN